MFLILVLIDFAIQLKISFCIFHDVWAFLESVSMWSFRTGSISAKVLKTARKLPSRENRSPELSRWQSNSKRCFEERLIALIIILRKCTFRSNHLCLFTSCLTWLLVPSYVFTNSSARKIALLWYYVSQTLYHNKSILRAQELVKTYAGTNSHLLSHAHWSFLVYWKLWKFLLVQIKRKLWKGHLSIPYCMPWVNV